MTEQRRTTSITLDIKTWRRIVALRQDPTDTLDSVLNDLLDERAGEKYTSSKSVLNELQVARDI